MRSKLARSRAPKRKGARLSFKGKAKDMGIDRSFGAGWLSRDLEAAVNEAKNWPEGMRRGIAVDDLKGYHEGRGEVGRTKASATKESSRQTGPAGKR